MQRKALVAILTFSGLLVLWQLATSVFGLISPGRFPSPAETIAAFEHINGRGYANGTLLAHALNSVQLVAMGFAVAVLTGVPLGLLMGWSRKAEAIINPVFLIVRPGFAKEKPELVAKFLAVFLRGVEWSKANPQEARKMLVDFYSDGGVEISQAAVNAEFETRPTFGVEKQLELLDRKGGDSTVDKWLTAIGDFMTSVGTTQSTPKAADYIDPRFMKMVIDDPKLRAFATLK